MLAVVGAVHLVAAGVFAAVGLRIAGRKVETAHDLARLAFVTWWLGFGTYLLLRGSLLVLAAAGIAPFTLFLAFSLLSGPLLAAAAGGLAFHIVFLLTGRNAWAVPIAFYYGAAGGMYSTWIWVHGPQLVAVSSWTADLGYNQPLEGPLWSFVLASFGVPLILGSFAYLSLALKVQERAKRYRILLFGSSLLVWVVAGYLAQAAAGPSLRFFAVVILGLLTTFAMLAAYYPPAPIRRWLEQPTPAPS